MIRVVRKQGDYGEFLNIESGETHVHYDEKGEIVPTVKIKAWFKIPSDPVLIHELASMLNKAAISLKEKEEELDRPDPVEMSMHE